MAKPYIFGRYSFIIRSASAFSILCSLPFSMLSAVTLRSKEGTFSAVFLLRKSGTGSVCCPVPWLYKASFAVSLCISAVRLYSEENSEKVGQNKKFYQLTPLEINIGHFKPYQKYQPGIFTETFAGICFLKEETVV